MFHLVLVLPILIIVLIAIATIAVGILGGVLVAAIIKNKKIKKFLIMGFCIIFLTGVTAIIPFLTFQEVISNIVGYIAACIFLAIIFIISLVGERASARLINNPAKITLKVVFSLVEYASLAVFLASLGGLCIVLIA